MRSTLLSLVISGTISMGCAPPKAGAMPEPSTTEYFKTLSGGFISTGNTLNYAMRVQPRKPVNGTNTWFAQIEYENPENLQQPLVQFVEFQPGQASFSLQSENLYSIKNHKTYKVTLKAFQNPERTTLITVHEMFVRFEIPDEMTSSWDLKFL